LIGKVNESAATMPRRWRQRDAGVRLKEGGLSLSYGRTSSSVQLDTICWPLTAGYSLDPSC
jgi:hypothetical protein